MEPTPVTEGEPEQGSRDVADARDMDRGMGIGRGLFCRFLPGWTTPEPQRPARKKAFLLCGFVFFLLHGRQGAPQGDQQQGFGPGPAAQQLKKPIRLKGRVVLMAADKRPEGLIEQARRVVNPEGVGKVHPTMT